MAKGGIELKGMYKLTSAMREKCSLGAVKTIVQRNGDRLNSTMKRTTHSAFRKTNPNTGRPYSTGDTARSINTVMSDNGLTATVGPTMKYDMYVELGTRFMEAEPFVQPAFNTVKPQFFSDMDKLVK